MLSKKSIDFEIGFADSELLSYSSNNNNLVIYLRSWNGKIIKFEFEECILFFVLDSWEISDICETSNSLNMERALHIVYEIIPKEHPYKLYQFINNDDESTVEVGAKKILISIVDSI